MANFKRILVGLDFSSADANVLAYTQVIANLVKPASIYFVHINPALDLPPEILQQINADLMRPDSNTLLDKLNASVDAVFESTEEMEIHTTILEGNPFTEILRMTHEKDTDLLIVGKKDLKNGSGVTAQKLARKVDSSMLFVPEKATVKSIERILLPIDFSKKSKLAIDTVANIFEDQPIQLLAANCYSLPLGWEKTGKSHDEFQELMKRHAEEKFSQFFEAYEDSGIEMSSLFSIDENQEPSDEILEMAEKNNADIVLIGARGKSDIATFILGSTTEKLLSHQSPLPIWVIKKKGENINWIEAIFKMK